MTESPNLVPAANADPDTALSGAIALIDELVRVIECENETLGRGFPASLVGTTTRKNALGAAFEVWVMSVRSRTVDLSHCDENLRAQLVARTKVLNEAVSENVDRLRAAIDASHRRLDALMRAIREDIAQSAPYGANGRVAPPPAAARSLRSRLQV